MASGEMDVVSPDPSVTIFGTNAGRLASRAGGPQTSTGTRFWVSASRTISSPVREVLEVSLGSRRIINHISFTVSRFPLILGMEWRTESGEWKPVEYALDGSPIREAGGSPVGGVRGITQPVKVLVAECYPAKINTARTTTEHPQHFGIRHWMRQEWKVAPIFTDRLRFVIRRNPNGQAPRNAQGQPVPYSVALDKVKIGYRADQRSDIPATQVPGDPWETSTDIIGSTLVHSLYEQGAGRVVDGSLDTSWRCEPQPVNYSVVNLFMDMRDDLGRPQVVDRFSVDPITSGVHCNLYFSNSEAQGDFIGGSEAVPFGFRTEVGSPSLYSDSETSFLTLGPDAATGVSVSNVFLRARYSEAWWFAVDAIANVEDSDTSSRPILSVGGHSVVLQGESIIYTAPSGETASLPLDADLHGAGTNFSTILAYFPSTPDRAAHIRLSYKADRFDPVSVEQAIQDIPEGYEVSAAVGLDPDLLEGASTAISVLGAVLKAEPLTEESERDFWTDGSLYVRNPTWDYWSPQYHTNALLRMHPSFVSPTNPFGVVGGPGEQWANMSWKPINRDYILRRGDLLLPFPVSAKYWKFEFTRLQPQVYETYRAIRRVIQCFPPHVVDNYNKTGPSHSRSYPASGMPTLSAGNNIELYSDALQGLRMSTASGVSPASVQALVITTPQGARRGSDLGWIWQYQPWHTGSLSPRWSQETIHRYERIPIQHNTKIAYFVGIREISAYRTAFESGDDTEEYQEAFVDQQFIESSSNMTFDNGGMTANGFIGEAVSKTLNSYQKVRGVQFATQETASIQVLPDPDFVYEDVGYFYHEYGDATLDRIDQSNLEVRRGWVGYTYADHESRTYSDLDDMTYGTMEGNLSPSGSAEGGLITTTYQPIGEGLVSAVVKVSSSRALSGPIAVEILSVGTDEVVASTVYELAPGGVKTITAEFPANSLIDYYTYAEVEMFPDGLAEASYGDLEAYTYAEIEAEGGIDTSVYVRVRQLGPSDDSFKVHRVGLYWEPIVWSFSVDGGASWYPALGVKNRPNGVLTFPVPGTQLKWKVQAYQPGVTVSALAVRPWYGSRFATAQPASDLDFMGPNMNPWDTFPPLHAHPLWRQLQDPIEPSFVPPQIPSPFWRNLVLNPGAEGASLEEFEAEGGTVGTVMS